MRGREKQNTYGFTLFELLASIAVMAILASIAVVGLSKMDNARSLDSAQSQLHALMRVARSQAILNGTEARLIVNFDAADEDRFLRFAGVVVKDLDDVDGDSSTDWVASHNGIYLPEGIFFVPQSKVTFTDNWDTSTSDRKSKYPAGIGEEVTAVENYEYPSIDPVEAGEGTDPEWIYLEFGPSGKLSSGASGVHVSLSEGGYAPGSGLVFEDSQKVIGIHVRRTGYSFSVDDPDAL